MQPVLAAKAPFFGTNLPLTPATRHKTGMALRDGQPVGNPPPRQPMLNLPPAVLALIGANVVVHIAMLLLPLDTIGWILVHLAFIPVRYSVEGLGGWPAWVGPLPTNFCTVAGCTWASTWSCWRPSARRWNGPPE